jgi:rhodanese-related sulfurtransferase
LKKTLIAAVATVFALSGASTAFAGNSLLLETATEAIALKLANEVQQGGYKLVSAAELKKMIDAKEDMVLIDAHPPEEFVLAYIAGATNFGFQSNRNGKWEEDALGKSQDDYRKVLGPDLNKKIVIYCGFTKCGRSHNAAMWAKQMGYTNLYRAPGGISAWMDAGYPYKTLIK